MIYGQQFRLGLDKHHLLVASWLCQLKQRLLERFLIGWAWNQHGANVGMPGGCAAVSRAQTRNLVFLRRPGFNFPSLTEADCLWQSNLSVWHICSQQDMKSRWQSKGMDSLSCLARRDLTLKRAAFWGKDLFFICGRRTWCSTWVLSSRWFTCLWKRDRWGTQDPGPSQTLWQKPRNSVLTVFISSLCKSEKSNGPEKVYC